MLLFPASPHAVRLRPGRRGLQRPLLRPAQRLARLHRRRPPRHQPVPHPGRAHRPDGIRVLHRIHLTGKVYSNRIFILPKKTSWGSNLPLYCSSRLAAYLMVGPRGALYTVVVSIQFCHLSCRRVVRQPCMSKAKGPTAPLFLPSHYRER